MWGVSTAKRRTADLSTALRSGRDDKFVAWRDSVFPGEVRGTTDPSASLGMTKESASLLWTAVSGPKAFFITFGGAQDHHSSARDDKFVVANAFDHQVIRTAVSRSQICHLDRSVAQ